MAKTLYDILEVSSSASAEAIRAAYERLSAKFDPYTPDNQGKADIRLQYDAVKEAFLTLGNLEKRRRYDRAQASRSDPFGSGIDAAEPFWTAPKLAALAIVVLIGGGWYFQHKQAESRLAAQRAIAEAQAREAEAKAKAEAAAAAQARLAVQRERDIERSRKYQENRTRSELERARRDYERTRQSQEANTRYADERQAREQRSEAQRRELEQKRRELEQQRAEAASVAEARRRAAREREELCRIERERYGKAISC